MAEEDDTVFNYLSDYSDSEFYFDKVSTIVSIREGRTEICSLPEHVKRDPEVAYTALVADREALRYLPELRNSYEHVLTAVQHHGGALAFASKDIQKDPRVCATAVRNNGFALQWVEATCVRGDKDVIDAALGNTKGDGDLVVLQCATKALTDDEEFLVNMLQKHSCGNAVLEVCSERLKKDKAFVCEALKHCKKAEGYKFVHESICRDRDVVMAMVSNQDWAENFVDLKMLTIGTKAFRCCLPVPTTLPKLGIVVDFLRQDDRELAFKAIEKQPGIVPMIYKSLTDMKRVDKHKQRKPTESDERLLKLITEKDVVKTAIASYDETVKNSFLWEILVKVARQELWSDDPCHVCAVVARIYPKWGHTCDLGYIGQELYAKKRSLFDLVQRIRYSTATRGARLWVLFKIRYYLLQIVCYWGIADLKAHFDENGAPVMVGAGAKRARNAYEAGAVLPTELAGA